jgi:ectoine hydroxylase-related dioxygenase (phytanoyl-CoA dioxygenase family)
MPATLLAPTATVDEVVQTLDRDGFAIIERYLPPDDVARKKADLHRILATVPTGRNDFEGLATRRIYAFFAKTRTFDAQAIDPLVLGVTERVIGPGPLLSDPQGISIAPGETAQRLHRDENLPFARPRQEVVLNTMWALDDFTEENGATHVVPGSHKWVDRVPDPARDEVIQAVMPAGSVMFFTGSVFHGGGANRTSQPRLGVILLCCAPYLRTLENQFLAVPKQIVRRLDPRLQQMLGYSLHGTFQGKVDGRHPRKYLVDRREVADGVLVEPNAGPDGGYDEDDQLVEEGGE